MGETRGRIRPAGRRTAPILFGGGTLQYSASNNSDYSGRFSTAGNQPISIDTNGQSVTFATAITGSETSLTLNDSPGTGTLTLSASNSSYTGGTTVNAGSLVLASGVDLSGSGAMTLSGGSLFSISSGTIGGTVVSGGSPNVIVPGSNGIGSLSIGGGLNLNSNSTLAFDISAGSTDLLAITGALAVSGTSKISFISSGSLANSYTLASFGSTTTSASNFSLVGARAAMDCKSPAMTCCWCKLARLCGSPAGAATGAPARTGTSAAAPTVPRRSP